jgi:hypothetical protein
MNLPPKPPPPDDPAGPSRTTALPEPLDLRALLTQPAPSTDFLAEPVLPVGKLVGLTATRGDGKSLLALEIACAKAAGRQVLSQPEGTPIHVVYLDMEMGPDDLYDRLPDLGYGPDNADFGTLVDHLHYYQLPNLPPLDTEAGGQALEALVNRHGAVLVVVDTLSRVVAGKENETETYRDLFTHTEKRLKRLRIAVLRLDHLGKDKERGSRGASAKEDPLDLVWQVSVSGDQVVLKRTKGRPAGVPEQVVLKRTDLGGRVAHVVLAEPLSSKARVVVANLDRLDVAPSASVNDAQKQLQAAGCGVGRTLIVEAVRHRRNRRGTVRNRPPEPKPGTASGTAPEPAGTAPGSLSEPPVPPIEGNRGPRPLPRCCEGCGRRWKDGTCLAPDCPTNRKATA